jgi:type II restriction enzyme
MKFLELGYASEDDYFKEFFSTLLNSNRTADFFVNWNKVYKNIKAMLDEISLLNGLVNIKDFNERKRHLKEILSKYPKTRFVLPLIIATRDEQLDLLVINEIRDIKYLNINFKNSDLDTLLKFCEQTRIVELLGNIKDLNSYLLGIEVGSDTNARKNRSGTIFEELVMKKLKDKGIDVRAAKKKYQLGNRSKKPDMVIYKENKEFAIVEVNFFHELGSKPLETIQSFIKLQEDAKAQNIKFILVTDGPAWKTGKIEREKAFEQIDYLFNLTLAIKLIPKMVV